MNAQIMQKLKSNFLKKNDRLRTRDAHAWYGDRKEAAGSLAPPALLYFTRKFADVL